VKNNHGFVGLWIRVEMRVMYFWDGGAAEQ